MTRLATVPRHLLNLPPTPTPDPEREVVLSELRELRRALSVSAARVRCNRESIMREVEAVESVLVRLRELAERA